MPSDAINYDKLAREMNETLSGGRIDKIVMSDKSTLMLTVRAHGENRNLLITAAASPRCYLASARIGGTEVPLSFCLHLRRHIGGGIINKVETVPFERILYFRITARGDLGESIERILIVEIMGKYSNVVLTDENFRITDSLKHVGLDESRPVMPGIAFVPPRDDARLDPTDELPGADNVNVADLPALMVKRLRGLSAATATEITDIARRENVPLGKACSILLEKPMRPVVYYRDGKPFDFSFCDYATVVGERKTFRTLCEAIDEYFKNANDVSEKTLAENAVKRVLNAALDKQRKKLAVFRNDRLSASDYEHERVLGELITANLYKIKKGDPYVVADNWYDGTQVNIKLTENTPQEDAQKHFKRYQKKKRTVENLAERIAECEKTIDYLESVETALACAVTAADINEVADELEEYGFLTRQNRGKKKNESTPRKYVIDGFTVLVGKSNLQNEKITKEARGDDIWLHTQGFHGSHVILKTGGKEPPASVLSAAASLAAFFSKARQSENVPVDYTRVKNVHKQRGAAPGKVDYFGGKTLYVLPEIPDKDAERQ